MAVNCWLRPAATDAEGGVTAIEVRTGAVTVRPAEPLMLPEAAVIVADPCATPVARPTLVIEATPVAEELQVTAPVTFCVVPLL